MTVSAEGAPGSVVLALSDGPSAPISALNEGRFRYEPGAARLEYSENGSAWTPLGGGGASPWTNTAGTIYPNNLTDDVVIGAVAMSGSERLRVVGDTLHEGNIDIEYSASSRYIQSVNTPAETAGGWVILKAGNGSTSTVASRDGGKLVAQGGTGGASSGWDGGGGGDAEYWGGTGGGTTHATRPGGPGGDVTVSGGWGGDATGSGDGGAGGGLSLQGGTGKDPTGTGVRGDGGTVNVNGGSGLAGGPVNVYGGTAYETGNGGAVTVRGGNATGSGINGIVNIGTTTTSAVYIAAPGISTHVDGDLHLSANSWLRMTERATDPVTLSNEGALYTKDDGLGGTQLFYREDTNGPIHQITPAGGASPWTNTAGTVYPNNTTDDVVVGATAMLSTEKFRVVGDTSLQGDIIFEQGADRNITMPQMPAGTLFANNIWVKAAQMGDESGGSYGYAGDLYLEGGDGGSHTTVIPYYAGAVNISGGEGASTSSSGDQAGTGGAVGIVGGRGGNQSTDADGGDGGSVLITGGQGRTPSGSGNPGVGGNVVLSGGPSTGGVGSWGKVIVGAGNTQIVELARSMTLTGTGHYIEFANDGYALFDERTVDPTTGIDQGALYTKDDGLGGTQLFYREDNSGPVHQITPAVASPWTNTAGTVYPNNLTDNVVVGATSMSGSEKLRVVGDTNLSGDIEFSNDVTHWVRPLQSSGSGVSGQRLHLYGGQGADDAATPGIGGVLRAQGGDGGAAVNVAGGTGGGATIAAGSGGDATGTGDGGDGGKLLLAGGVGTAPSGTGGEGDGGDAELRGGPGDVGGDAYLRGGIGTTTNGNVIVGDGFTAEVQLGAAGKPVIVFGHQALAEQASDPAATADQGKIYTKDDSGVTQLFYRADDGTIYQLTPTGQDSSTGVQSASVYTCPSGLVVGDAVQITGANAVDKADASVPADRPVIGFVKSKPTSTTCILHYYGELPVFTGLTVGATYYLSDSTPGTVTTTAPSTIGSIVQEVGFARNSTTLVVFIDPDYTTL